MSNLPCVAVDGSVPATQATAILTQGELTQVPYNSTFQNEGRTAATQSSRTAPKIAMDVLELTAGVRRL